MSAQAFEVASVRTVNERPRRNSSEYGAELVEFNLVLIPMLALVFLAADVAWAIFARASLQEAVREGVRYGVTQQTVGSACLDQSIRDVVAQYSAGLINTSNESTAVTIDYYSQSAPGTNLAGKAGAIAGGNILQVSVSGISLKPIAPFFGSISPMSLSASAADVLESSPNNIPPCE